MSAARRPRMPPRLSALRAVDRAGAHRYVALRRLTTLLTASILYAIPAAGLARFDLWAGRHRLFGRLVGPVFGAESLFVFTIAFYATTLVLNAALGRIFCGWGCPLAETSRLGDHAELARRTRSGRVGAEARAAAYALLIGGGVFLWLADPRVFVEGSSRALALAVLGLTALSTAAYLHGRFVRWSFCRTWCPIGAYYSAIQTAHKFGIHFDEASCKECDACTRICPVELHPRDLGRARPEQGGISIGGFPEHNHCLTCGDCVRACENAFKNDARPLVALRLSRRDRHA